MTGNHTNYNVLTDRVRERPHFLTFHKINNFSTKVNDSFQEVHILLHLGYIWHILPCMFCHQLFTFNKVKYGCRHIGLKTRLKFEANIDTGTEKLQLQVQYV